MASRRARISKRRIKDTNNRIALLPQRSSLRQALRASLVLSALTSQVVDKGDGPKHTPPSNSKTESVALANPNRSSLHVDLRESLSTTSQVFTAPVPLTTPPAPAAPTQELAQDNADDMQPTSASNGWYEVRGIVHEAPGGLYLVDWEGTDPRTGAMWPASWVAAQDVSASAIKAWEKKKRQALPGRRGKPS